MKIQMCCYEYKIMNNIKMFHQTCNRNNNYEIKKKKKKRKKENIQIKYDKNNSQPLC